MKKELKIVQLPIGCERKNAVELMGGVFSSVTKFMAALPERCKLYNDEIHIVSLDEHVEDLNDEVYPTDVWTTYIYIEKED